MAFLQTFYRTPALGQGALERIRRTAGFDPGPLNAEYCIYVQSSEPLNKLELATLRRRLATSYLPQGITNESQLTECPTVIEIGPRLTFQTVASSTSTAVFNDCGIPSIQRVERSVRLGTQAKLTEDDISKLLAPLFQTMVFDRMTQERYPATLTTLNPERQREPLVWIPIMTQGKSALEEFCQQNGISFDDQDMDHVFSIFDQMERRDATDSELRYLGNQLSEHCGHAYWKSLRRFNGRPAEHTMMEWARLPWETNPGNALIAFNDEGSSWYGLRPVIVLMPEDPGKPSRLVPQLVYFHPVLADESHCHPSKVCPEEGAATGVARVRDNICVGRGAEMGCGHFAVIVGNLCISDYTHEWEDPGWVPIGAVPSREIATKSRLGAWKFGNALGEPVPGGSFITLGVDPGDGYRSFFKPDIFTGGLSLLRDEHVVKIPATPGKHLGKWGGPRLPVGLGGGFRSSTSADVGDNLELAQSQDFDSVQRGAPEMQQRGVRVVRACIESGTANPLDFPKDGGAGGDGTAISETAEPCGIEVDQRSIPSGDLSMSPSTHTNNESQEQHYSPIQPGPPMEFVSEAARRERCPFTDIGVYNDSGKVVFRDDWAEVEKDRYPINLPLAPIFGKRPQKVFDIPVIAPVRYPLRLPNRLTMATAVDRILRLPSVACKGWLTNHVDRSVSGRIAQQSCIGPYQLPASDYWIMANSALDQVGTVLASAVRPHLGLISGKALANMTLAEALISISGAENEGLEATNCEVNWFSDVKSPGEGQILEETASTLAHDMIRVGMRQLGGKDSSSGSNLALSPDGQKTKVKWPVTIFVTLGVQMADITRKVTPLIEDADTLIHIDLSPESKPLGASALAQVFAQTGNDCADVNIDRVIAYFNETQRLLRQDKIKSLHDISDGGLITTLCEMAFVSGVGLDIVSSGRYGWLRHYFSEAPGVVIACKAKDTRNIIAGYKKAGIRANVVSKVQRDKSPQIKVRHNQNLVFAEEMLKLRQTWMETSFQLDAYDANIECVKQERAAMSTLLTPPPYKLTYTPDNTPKRVILFKDKPKAAVIRAPGSNGDRELAGMFYQAGFDPYDIMTTDLIDGRASLDPFQVAGQAGGFSYQDEPLEAGVGWAASIEENPRAWEQYRNFFFERQDTLSYSPCNGTQVATLLGIAPDQSLPLEKRPRFLQNLSGMFESRYVTVKIENSPAIMFQGMEGSILGLIIAHGEGRLYCHDQSVMDWIVANNLIPLTYVGPDGEPTMTYPFNPNGSPIGAGGVCTPDGRHVATMGHIERGWQLWQLPGMPFKWRRLKASPWVKPGQNMYTWCMEHRS